MYIDESGFTHDMPRTHGYSFKGKRCWGVHNWGAKGRTNVIGALLGSFLLTVSLFQGNVNSEVFTAWIQQDLLPKLPPKSVVVMDNTTFHKGQTVQQIIEDAEHTLLYLPPYCPDLNPIEHKWAQAKAHRPRLQCPINDLFQLPNL